MSQAKEHSSEPVASHSSTPSNSIEQEKTLLEVGDIIYAYEKWGSDIGRYTIERVTQKQAFYKHGRCKRELFKSHSYSEGYSATIIGSYGTVDLETPALKERYELQQTRKLVSILTDRVKTINLSSLSKNQLQSMVEMLNSVLKVKECDATKDDKSDTDD